MGRLSTVDLLIKVACFVKKKNDIFNRKMSLSELVSTRRSTVLSLSLQLNFPGLAIFLARSSLKEGEKIAALDRYESSLD
jgi:hypothetical protein